MLLFVQGTRIQASILGKHVNAKYENTLLEGETYFIANFEVVKNADGYKATLHQFRLLFNGSTFIRHHIADIPNNSYEFMSVCDVIKSDPNYFPDHLIGNSFICSSMHH